MSTAGKLDERKRQESATMSWTTGTTIWIADRVPHGRSWRSLLADLGTIGFPRGAESRTARRSPRSWKAPSSTTTARFKLKLKRGAEGTAGCLQRAAGQCRTLAGFVPGRQDPARRPASSACSSAAAVSYGTPESIGLAFTQCTSGRRRSWTVGHHANTAVVHSNDAEPGVCRERFGHNTVSRVRLHMLQEQRWH